MASSEAPKKAAERDGTPDKESSPAKDSIRIAGQDKLDDQDPYGDAENKKDGQVEEMTRSKSRGQHSLDKKKDEQL